MKKKLLSILSIIIVAGMLAVLPACEEVQEDITEITFIHGWGSTEADHVAMRQIYNDFEKENPDVRINMLSMPTNGEMLRKVEDMIASGKIPDVIFTAGEGTGSVYEFMNENGMLTDINIYAKDDADFSESISPITTETWTDENGALYTASDVLILSGGYWYNKEIFKSAGISEIPQTWEEFDSVLTRIEEWAKETDNGVVPIMPSGDAYLYIADETLYELGELEDKFGHKVSRGAFEKICDRWKSVYSHIDTVPGDYSYRDEVALFNEGKLAIFVNGVWGASMISSDIKAGYALLPSNSGRSVSCQTAALGYLIGNCGDEKRIDASMRFLKYILSEEVQKRILLETQQMPSNPNINISDYYSKLERFCLAVETVQHAEDRIDIPQLMWTERQTETIDRLLPQFLAGEITIDEFAKFMDIQ